MFRHVPACFGMFRHVSCSMFLVLSTPGSGLVLRDHSDHGRSNEPMDKDSSVYLIFNGPSDLGSLILMQIIPKERTSSHIVLASL